MREYKALTIKEHIKITEMDIIWAKKRIKKLKILLKNQEQALKDLKEEE